MKNCVVVAIALYLTASAAYAQVPMIVPPAAKPNVGVLPPVEFDKPYTGKLKVIRGDAFLMSKLCPKTSYPVTLACAYTSPDQSQCIIIIATDDIIHASGWSVEIVFRHERGHCESWDHTHRGARPVTPETLENKNTVQSERPIAQTPERRICHYGTQIVDCSPEPTYKAK
jgi:hypothetical protein